MAKKSKSKWYKFKGIASYAQIYRPDEFRGKSNWKINLHPDEETIKEIKKAGIQLELKNKTVENAEGPFFTFKRPTEKEFQNGTTYFAPPVVLDKKGKVLIEYEQEGETCTSSYDSDDFDRVGETILIGNGSLVELTVEVYETKSFGKGNRLHEVKILDLVEYEEVDEDEVDGEGENDEAPFDTDEPEVKEEKKSTRRTKAEKKDRKVDW